MLDQVGQSNNAIHISSILMSGHSLLNRALLVVLLCAATLTGCSRVTLVYNTADFLVQQYANDYLGLTSDQRARWEPRLASALARHRVEELPHLAAFFERALQANQAGFDAANMTCLTAEARALYQRQARLAVDLAAPLLADLTPSQLDDLERKFREEAREDREDLAKRDTDWEKRKRARRYLKAVEKWTGALNTQQEAIVAEVTARMPDSQASVVDYRSAKRQRLIAQLRGGARETEINAFMTAWLIDFSDLPPALERDAETIEARLSELFIRLGASFDVRQRAHVDKRLRQLRDDLMKLQARPRMAPMSC